MTRAQTRSLVVGVYLAVAIVGGSLLIIRGIGRIGTLLPQKPTYDLVVDWAAARAFVDGFNPYSPEGLVRAQLTKVGNGHPPSTIFWALPLARYDLPIARQVLFELSILLLLIELGLIAIELRVPFPWYTAWLTLGLVLCCDWMDYLFYVGQWSQIIAFAYFCAWYSLRRGWDVRAGLAVGAACTIKVYPGVLFLMLLLGRRWRACAAASVTYLTIAAVMTVRFGLASWPQFVAQQSATGNQWMASIQNQSIHGFVLRFFGSTCEPRSSMRPVSTVISVAAAASLLAAAAWLGRKAAGTRDRLDVVFALSAVLSVFTSNWAWEHYNVLFLLPIAVVASQIVRMNKWEVWRGWTAVVGVLLLAVVTSLGVPFMEKGKAQAAYRLGPTPGRHVWLHVTEGLNMVPVLALSIALFVLLWLSERRERLGQQKS